MLHIYFMPICLFFAAEGVNADASGVVMNMWSVGTKAFRDYSKHTKAHGPVKGAMRSVRDAWIDGHLHPLIKHFVCFASNMNINITGYRIFENTCYVMSIKGEEEEAHNDSMKTSCMEGWTLLTFANSTKCVNIFKTEPVTFKEAEKMQVTGSQASNGR